MNGPFDDIRNKRMSELTPEQYDRAQEAWLRENVNVFGSYYGDTPEALLPSVLRVIDRLRAPIDMVLRCPACRLQHIDAAEPSCSCVVCNGVGRVGFKCQREEKWTNPLHRSHLCHGCGHIWRPADVPTNGVAAVKTKGRADSAQAGASLSEAAAAVRTLEMLGYTYHGADLWKPPLGIRATPLTDSPKG